MRIPPITSIDVAIELYYSKRQLFNADIRKLFGNRCGKTVCNLKEEARKIMREKDTPSWNAVAVNTADAYEAWGLEIKDLERRYEKLEKLRRERA